MEVSSGRKRRRVGFALWLVLCVVGALLNVVGTRLQIASAGEPEVMAHAVVMGAIPAFAMLLIYLPVPAVLDRFDPEPWWCVAMAFSWGALAATGIAGFTNFQVLELLRATLGKNDAMFYATVYCAPITEEIMKGVFILGMLAFLRREFDGVVDGIIYAIFCALGFAAVENVQYYARALIEGQDVYTRVFVLRGIVAPWGHPLYTSMTGIGFGIARESTRTLVRISAPVLGLVGAILLHALWNFVPNLGGGAFVLSLLFWFVFVIAFMSIVVILVARKGRIIRAHLADEVILGTITEEELRFVTSAFGRMRTYFMPGGPTWRKLIGACARLGLSKWHAARARKRKKGTVSFEFIAPLRDEVKRLLGVLRGLEGSPRRKEP